jgi:ferredoxin
MKKVVIVPGCTTCGRCEFIAPEVFEVTDIAHVKKDANVDEHEAVIQEAIKTCPVQVIKYNCDDKSA